MSINCQACTNRKGSGAAASDLIDERAKNRHFPKFVVHRHLSMRRRRGRRDDAVGLVETRYERLLADHVRASRKGSQAMIGVAGAAGSPQSRHPRSARASISPDSEKTGIFQRAAAPHGNAHRDRSHRQPSLTAGRQAPADEARPRRFRVR